MNQPTPPPISFMSANYVARDVGYHMTDGWNQGDSAANATFQPLATFRERFAALLSDITAMGYTALDLWTGHLNWAWATTDHLAIARELLAAHHLRIASLAGNFGQTPHHLRSACHVAQAVGAPILGGSTALITDDRASLIAILKDHNLRLGLENHPEKTPDELLAKIGADSDGAIGAAIDTGWFATQGYDPVQAIERLWPAIVHVHLKDILAVGAHDTCRYGQGIVPIAACVATLKRLGYTGDYSVEHEPEHYDPTADCAAMLPMLRDWLAQV